MGVQSPPQTAADIDKQHSQELPQPEAQGYFTGKAADNSWDLSLEAKSDGSFPLRLNLNNGTEVFSGDLQKEGLMKGSKPNVATGEVKFSGNIMQGEKSEALTISIIHQSCSDNEGKPHSHSISFQFAGKAMKGCGEYAAD